MDNAVTCTWNSSSSIIVFTAKPPVPAAKLQRFVNSNARQYQQFGGRTCVFNSDPKIRATKVVIGKNHETEVPLIFGIAIGLFMGAIPILSKVL